MVAFGTVGSGSRVIIIVVVVVGAGLFEQAGDEL